MEATDLPLRITRYALLVYQAQVCHKVYPWGFIVLRLLLRHLHQHGRRPHLHHPQNVRSNAHAVSDSTPICACPVHRLGHHLGTASA